MSGLQGGGANWVRRAAMLAPLISGLALLMPPPASAQPAQKVPEAESQDPKSTPGTKRPEQLGDKLARSEGVIEPPESVDPEMQKRPPEPAPNKMPVIPPPGTPGGDENARPK